MANRVIFKYPLSIERHQFVAMPHNSHLLSVGVQHDEPVLWALVDPVEATVKRQLLVVGTGHVVPDIPGMFLGTVQLEIGAPYLVLHVFDLWETVE